MCCSKELKENERLSRSTSYGSHGSRNSQSGSSPSLSSPKKRKVSSNPTRQSPVPFRINVIAVVLLSVACVLVVEFVFPMYKGTNGLGMPVWGTVVVILYSFCCAFGCAVVYATVGQQFSGGVCILLQVLFGYLVPGSARANVRW